MADDFKMYSEVYRAIMRIKNDLNIIADAITTFCNEYENEPKLLDYTADKELIIRNLNDPIQKDLP